MTEAAIVQKKTEKKPFRKIPDYLNLLNLIFQLHYLSRSSGKPKVVKYKGKLVHIATPEMPWLTYDWGADIEVVDGVSFKLNEVVKTV